MKPLFKRRCIGTISGILILILMLLIVGAFFIANALSPLNLEQKRDHSTTVYSKNGEVLRQFSNSKGIFRTPVKHQVLNGKVVRLVSDVYLTALLEYEDKYFYVHPGFNPFSLARALFQQVTHGRVISGGSTITMQVARMFYPYERSYVGKVEQIFRAMQIERHYNKEEILDLYLTHTPMGGNIEGVEAGAQRYFGKSAQNLNLTESLTLVVLPQRPSSTRPDRHPQRALTARNKVLHRVSEALALTDSTTELLTSSPLGASRHLSPVMSPLLARKLRSNQPNLTEFTTFIDHTLQSSIEMLISKRSTNWSSTLSSAVLVMENETGEVIAYKGSADFTDLRRYGHVDMVQAIRSPGSTLKPFIYGMALEKQLIHSGSLMMDIPISHGNYQPQNFNRYFSGPIRMDKALQLSKNSTVVQILSQLGPEAFLRFLKISQIPLKADEANLTFALGGVGTNLAGLVSLYSSLATEGNAIQPRYLNSDSKTQHTLLTPAASWILFDILSHIPPPQRFAPAHGRKVAWKTGTSYGFRDAWSIGVSPKYTVGVWVGRPDGSPNVGQTGAKQAAPIMFDVFDLLPPESKPLIKPLNVASNIVCWPSGLLKTQIKQEDCLSTQLAWLIDEQAPPTLRYQEPFNTLHQWPEPLQHWSLSNGIPLNQSALISPEKVAILTPQNETQFFPYSGQVLNLKASVDGADWYLNDQPLSQPQIEFDQLSDGRYQLTACLVHCDNVVIQVFK
ncbi:penicillin-binding protein 1C [Vibrio sp. S9_S30]|uniref:penicillin-binding protein 1C n=1 Tax=Vibrio sp. S9_S30 TaxID=2720226 RepID=UPI0016817F98|nr:penicillin-binding protein 1C [Vibrio sp. S9_S30]MBD1558456.1 penicillin-binding protein 1C [Vibrio sp. S9_S30]